MQLLRGKKLLERQKTGGVFSKSKRNKDPGLVRQGGFQEKSGGCEEGVSQHGKFHEGGNVVLGERGVFFGSLKNNKKTTKIDLTYTQRGTRTGGIGDRVSPLIV